MILNPLAPLTDPTPDPILPSLDEFPDDGLLEGLLDRARRLTQDEGDPTFDCVMKAFGRVGSLPLLILVALVIVSPLSGVPLFASVCGLTIASISLQLVAGRTHLWMPRWLRDRVIPRDRLDQVIERLRPLARWLDERSRPRLLFMTQMPVPRILLTICAVAGLFMPFLELLPFSSTLFAMAVTCIGFSLLTRDGIWALVGLLPLSAAGVLIGTMLSMAPAL